MKYFENQIPLYIRTLKNIKEITHMKINYTITRKILTAALVIICCVLLLTGCGSKTDAVQKQQQHTRPDQKLCLQHSTVMHGKQHNRKQHYLNPAFSVILPKQSLHSLLLKPQIEVHNA